MLSRRSRMTAPGGRGSKRGRRHFLQVLALSHGPLPDGRGSVAHDEADLEEGTCYLAGRGSKRAMGIFHN
jgi:hypothetical protein